MEPSTTPSLGDRGLSVPAPYALSWQAVTKTFGDKVAVNNLSLDIPHGSFYGIVGPNGAGKTTAVTIATGLQRPDSGDVRVNGFSVWNGGDQDAKRSFGLLADGLPVFDRLTGQEYLDFLGRLRGIASDEIAQRSADLLAALDLESAGETMIVDYSAGMTKKILLAGALLHRPQLLILDEPLEAVDPVSAKIIQQILHRFVAGGGTVVLSSHVMEIVEKLCDHVALIAGGEVRASGTLDDVRQGRSLADAFVELVGARELDQDALSWLNTDPDGDRS